MKRDKEHFRGCILGGAVGDALGWPVEFMSLSQIRSKYGQDGITDLDIKNNGKAEITDDTQMTIFTAEGLLRANTRFLHKGICDIRAVVYHSYIRWLHTQGYSCKNKEYAIEKLDGWVSKIKALNVKRAPGNSCLSSLMSGNMGTIENPINNSKGCGGVMRVAPVGLAFKKEEAFKHACEIAAITHGHPGGYLSSGVLSYIISAIAEGIDLHDSVLLSMKELKKYPGHEDCLRLLEKAVELAGEINPAYKAISQIGEGWVGDEAIAIAVYCSLLYKNDLRKALILSVNHDGDSDSTGAITGNILGTYLGYSSIPAEWVQNVELKDELVVLADDLLVGPDESQEWWDKYPG